MISVNKICTLFISLFLILLIFPGINSDSIKYYDIVYVDDDGTADYSIIQDAIDAVSNGDTIFVYSGVYQENLIINKAISLKGENRNNTIIESNTGLIIMLNSSNIYIEGLTIRHNTTDEDIFHHGIVNTINENYFENLTIYDCIITENSASGIQLRNFSNVVINKCLLSKNRGGSVAFYSSCNNISIINCTITNNGLRLDSGWYFNGGINFYIDDFYSSNVSINNCYINNSIGIGINLYKTMNIKIFNNYILNSDSRGIDISYSENINISSNVIINDEQSAIIIDECTNITIYNNNISLLKKPDNRRLYYYNSSITIKSSKEQINIMKNYIKNFYLGLSIVDSYKAYILNNTFIDVKTHANFVQMRLNSIYWNNNYWGKSRELPYPIFGLFIIFPWINFDWNPQ